MHFGVNIIERWELARTRWGSGSKERKRERGGGDGGNQGGLLKEVRMNESGATTVEREKYGTKERRHRPKRIDLGNTGGRLPRAERVKRRGKKVVAMRNAHKWRLFHFPELAG